MSRQQSSLFYKVRLRTRGQNLPKQQGVRPASCCPRGPFLESPGNVSGPVSHLLSPRYTFRVFLEFPAIIYPVIFPDNLPGNLREVTRSRKVTGKQHFVATQQNGCRRRTFLYSSSTKEVPRENSFR